MYRDFANYKNHSAVIFCNPKELDLATIDRAIREKLIDDLWFYAKQWHLKDLHFSDWDEEVDHNLHEYNRIGVTEASSTELLSIDKWLEIIPTTQFK